MTPQSRSPAALWRRALERTAPITPESSRTLARIVEEIAERTPDAAALVGSAETLTYADLAATIRRVARWASSVGLRRGDRVALMMANSPDYAALWLGFSRVGVVTALINTQLSGDGLAHCLAAASPTLAVADGACHPALVAVAGDTRLCTWSFDAPGCDRIDKVLAALDGETPLASEAPEINLRDPALLIYTSGTTGLPKAARVSHWRVATWSEWFAAVTEAGPGDRLYDCLPMYHSVGGVVAVGAMLAAGGAVIVREGFSLRRFWPDVVESGATIVQYIGEMCRYLVAAPPVEVERRHGVRLFCGNGLREDVWTAFAARFAQPRILEFYAATEGSFSLFNLEGRPGFVGRVPSFMAHRSPVALVRHDATGAEPWRGEDGFCRRCGVDETGEALGRLGDGRSGQFEGYTDADGTRSKVLRDVFATGDRWFRTGDLMTRDAAGFYRFVDRVGDTFRWKGENVSAAEVEAVLRRCSDVVEVAVYGVAVPGADGRAGMAALVCPSGPDVERLASTLAVLPRYARPVFLRFCSSLLATATFRHRKAELQQAAFHRGDGDDQVFVLRGDGYVELDSALATAIVERHPGWLRSL